MSLIVKIMSDEAGPDDDARKSFILIAGVARVVFDRRLGPLGGLPSAHAHVFFAHDQGEGERHNVSGNVYVMNEAGKTISTFCSAPMMDYGASEPESQPGEPTRLRPGEIADVERHGVGPHLYTPPPT